MADDDFYDSQSEASQIKARIVSKYFDFWSNVIAQQVKNGKKRLAYIDLFCGPGKYRDGKSSTPLLIMEKALTKPDLCEMLCTFFNDEDAKHTAALKSNLEALPGFEKLRNTPKISTMEISKAFGETLGSKNLMPSFSFVDPFGYKGITLDLLKGLLKSWGCDVVLFFSYNRINAAISNDVFEGHVSALFGSELAADLRMKLHGKKPDDREAIVIEAFSQALIKMGFEYVLPFSFGRGDMDRTSHHLIFISKHALGYGVMKNIMAAESSEFEQGVPTFKYTIATNQIEMPLLYLLSRPIVDLAEMLLTDFAGQKRSMLHIYEEHHVGKRYVERNYKDALIALEMEGRITAEPAKRKPYKGKPSFGPDVLVTFPKKEKS